MKTLFKYLVIGILALFVITHLPGILGGIFGLFIAAGTFIIVSVALAGEAIIGAIVAAIVGITLLGCLGLPVLALGFLVWIVALPFIALGKAIFS
jgi:hypothetical protein